jgi:hypothetical protein
MPKQQPKLGDVFWVPIEDGSFVLGQIVEIEPEVLNSITCAFFNCRSSSGEKQTPLFSQPISIQFVTRDLFSSGKWKRQANQPVQISPASLPYREAKAREWVGAKVIGSGIITMFLAAFYGLRSWEEMKDPRYYQNLLLPGVERRVYA